MNEWAQMMIDSIVVEGSHTDYAIGRAATVVTTEESARAVLLALGYPEQIIDAMVAEVHAAQGGEPPPDTPSPADDGASPLLPLPLHPRGS